MRTLPAWRWASLLVLLLMVVPSLGVLGQLEVEMTDPEPGAQLVLGETVDVKVTISNLAADTYHRIWFVLRIRRESWGEDSWVSLSVAPDRESGPTAFPTKTVRGWHGSWNGLAVVWDTARSFPRQDTDDPLAADDPYYLQIGITEDIHAVTDASRIVWSPEVGVTFAASRGDDSQQGEDEGDEDSEDEEETVETLSIGVHLKAPPHFAGESISFRILAPDPLDDVYQSFLWDFGDGTRSVEATPVHRFGTPGNYRVTLTAWRQPSHQGDSVVSNELRIAVLPPAPAVSATRKVLGFPSSLSATSPSQLLLGFDLQVQISIVVNDPSKARAFVVRERIPAGWALPEEGMTTTVSDDLEGRTRETQATDGSDGIAWREWLFRGPFTTGETVVLNYKLRPGATTLVGRYDLVGEVAIGTSDTQPVGGSSEVVLVPYLPIEVVIAHISRATALRDCDECPSQEELVIEPRIFAQSGEVPYTISDEQLDVAVCLWSNNCPVPYTGGQTISYTKLLELIELHETGRGAP